MSTAALVSILTARPRGIAWPMRMTFVLRI